MDETECAYCKSINKIITDNELGKQICTNCGFHVCDDNICEKQEWNYGNNLENTLCNNLQNPFFKKQSTTVWLTGVKPQVQITHKFHHVFPKKEPSLNNVYNVIDRIKEENPRLLNVAVCNDAKSFCQQLDESKVKIPRGNVRKGIIGAAILRALIKRNKNYLDTKIMAKMCKIDIKELCRGQEILDSYLFKQGYKDDQVIVSKSIKVYVSEFLIKLKDLEISEEVIKELFEFIEKVETFYYKINNKKNNIAIACLYHILKDYYDDNLKEFIIETLDINEITLGHCYTSLIEQL